MRIDGNTEAVKVLMQRDGLPLDEAIEQVCEAFEECMSALESGEDPEEIWMENLGLEPDYMFELL